MTVPFESRHAEQPAPISWGTRNLGKVTPEIWKWFEIGKRQSNPLVTPETFEEYQALNPDDKNELKNVGGYFYGGLCEGGSRKADAIKERTVLTLDLDKIDATTLFELQEGTHEFCRYEFFLHTTRGHTPEKPRVRLTLLASTPVFRDEFEAVIRLLAHLIDPNMKIVDRVSWRWAQLMFWPSVSADMRDEFIFHHNDGELVDKDALLASWPHDWRDYAHLPRDPDETDHHQRQAKAENPLEKRGWPGAFCRTYDVEDAIEKFELPYQKSDIAWSKPRYTYTAGSGLNGAVVEDGGLFLYSNHGTDPVSERLVNAFDLVRIHLFGDLDKDAPEGTTPTHMPSYKAMVNRIKDDPDVVANLDSTIDPTEAFENVEEPDDEDDDDEDLIGDFEQTAEQAADGPEAKPKSNFERQKEAVDNDKSPAELNLERMNKLHAIARIAGKTVALTFYKDHIEFGSIASLHEWYENNRIASGNSSIPLSKWWMMQPERRGYAGGVVFRPGKKVPSNVLNLWQGWSVEPSSTGSCDLYLTHLLENVCKGNEEHYRYLVGWMAHMIQRPWEKPGVAVVLRGKKGVGKDVVAVHLGRLFKQNYVAISEMEHLTGKFNAHMEKALLVHVEEGLWAGDPRAAGPLKSLITRSTVALERKGIDVIQIENCSRIFITSNEKWVVPATPDERRFAVFEVGDAHIKDRPYFRRMAQQMEKGGYGALLHFLQNYDLSDFDVGVPPETEGLAVQKEASLKGHSAYWLAELQDQSWETVMGKGAEQFKNENGRPDWRVGPLEVSVDTAYEHYKNWWKDNRGFGHGPLLSKEAFGKQLSEMCPSRKRVQRGSREARYTVHVLPDLATCRREFETYLGSKLAWPEEPEQDDDEADLVG